MNLLIVLGALVFLMFVAYRGYSRDPVSLRLPALGAVLLTDPVARLPPVFSSVFMEKTGRLREELLSCFHARRVFR
jgi:H+/gluconate symporter-like permease